MSKTAIGILVLIILVLAVLYYFQYKNRKDLETAISNKISDNSQSSKIAPRVGLSYQSVNNVPISNTNSYTPEDRTRIIFNWILNTLKNSNTVLTYELLKSNLESKGLIVVKEGDTTDSAYRTNRVTVRETQTRCTNPPCPSDFQLIKIG